MKTKVDDFIDTRTVSKVLVLAKKPDFPSTLGIDIFQRLQKDSPTSQQLTYLDLSKLKLDEWTTETFQNTNSHILILDFYERLEAPINLWIKLKLYKIPSLKVIIICESLFLNKIHDPTLYFSPFVFEKRVRSALTILHHQPELRSVQPAPIKQVSQTEPPPSLTFKENPFNQKDYTGNEDLLQLWSDALLRNEATHVLLKNIYLQFIHLSKNDPSYSFGSNNAMTLLVRSGELLCGENFDRAQLEKANMAGGYFDKSTFRGTNLRSAKLAYGWFREADFSDAILSQVDIGIKKPMKVGFDIHKAAFSKQSDNVAICDTNQVTIVNTVTQLTSFKKDTAEFITSLAFSNDGNFLLIGFEEFFILEDLYTPNSLKEKVNSSIISCEISDDNQFFLLGTESGTIQLWSLINFTLLHEFPAHETDVACVQFIPKLTDKIVSAGMDGYLRYWQVNDNQASLIVEFKDREVDIWGICTDNQGKIVMTAGEGGEVNLHILATRQTINIIRTDHCLRTIAYNEALNQLLIGDVTGTVRLVDIENKTLIYSAPFHGHDWVEKVYLATSSDEVISIGKDGSIYRFANNRTITPALKKRIQYYEEPLPIDNTASYPSHDSPLSDTYAPAHNTAIAAGYYDGSVHVFERENGNTIYKCQNIDPSPVWAVSFSTDLKTCISGHESGNLIIHEINSNKHTFLSKDLGRILSICLTQDNTTLISSHSDYGINVWDINTKSLTATFRSHTGIVKCVCQINNTSISLSGGSDHTLRLWDYGQNKELCVAKMTSAVNHIKVDKDNRIVIHCQDGNILTWKASKLADNTYSLSLVNSSLFYSRSLNTSNCILDKASISEAVKSVFNINGA